MSNNSRRRVLETTGLGHPRPEAVTSPLFQAGEPFFFALDKVQVKYEMLRAHFGEGDTVTDAAGVTWVLESRVLLGGRRVRRSRDDRAARRAPWPQRTGQANRRCATTFWTVSVRARRPRRPGGGRPAGRAPASADHPTGPAAMSPVLAGLGTVATRLRTAAVRRGHTGAATRRSCRRPVRSAGLGRPDRLARCRAGVLGRTGGRVPGRLDALRRSAPRRSGRHLPAPGRRRRPPRASKAP